MPMPNLQHTITAHIVVPDATTASSWYQRAFGAIERSRVPLPNGRVMTVELSFGDCTVMVASEFAELGILSPLTIGGTPVVLHLRVSDVARAWQKALDAGAEVVHPLADQFWGERQGQLHDPFGHKWNLAEHVRDVSGPELVEAAAAAFGGASPG
jgi:PhnB protein